MFVLFFIFWVILNGKFNLEIAIFGIAISAFMYWFICRYMDYSVKTEKKVIKNFFRGIAYIIVLIWEILKANVSVMKLIYSEKTEVEPELVYFKSNLKSDVSKIILANSITLTPGTVTVSLEGNEFCVHCLDKSLAEGIDSSVFVKMLKKMEQ